MNDKNADFLKFYNLDNNNDLIFKSEIKDVEVFDYVFNPEKDKISKKKILHLGIGKDSPDRESFVKVKLQLRINGHIYFNNFDIEDVNEYIINKTNVVEYEKWRTKINEEFNIKELGEEENFERDEKIYSMFDEQFVGEKTALFSSIDLRTYSLPIVLRKVLIHMKRNEIAYIKTNFIDYFFLNGIEIKNVKSDSQHIEIYVHLLEFLHRKLFSKIQLEDKLKDLTKMKELANNFFKEEKLFRACKIYQNINYRFNYGDVFGGDFENSENIVKAEYPLIYSSLIELRLNCHLNLAKAKFKLGKFFSVCEITSKVNLLFII
jgi:hypothetical protein